MHNTQKLFQEEDKSQKKGSENEEISIDAKIEKFRKASFALKKIDKLVKDIASMEKKLEQAKEKLKKLTEEL